MAGWKKHFSNLLNTRNSSISNCLLDEPSFEIIHSLSEPPTLQEVTKTINNLKNNKSPGPDGIPVELLKYGVFSLTTQLHTLVKSIWDAEEVPLKFEGAKITPIYRKNGEKATYGSIGGFPFLQ